MKRFLFIIAVLFALNVQAATFPIPIISGVPTLTAMGVHSPGDVGTIAPGIYNHHNFSNLIGITIQPLSGPNAADVFFTGGISYLLNDSSLYISGLTYSGISGDVINSDATHNAFITLSHVRFYNCTGTCWSGNGTFPWTSGNPLTFQFRNIVMDSITEFQCGKLFQCGFGDMTQGHPHPNNVSDSIVITRFVSTGTTATAEEGTEIRCAGLFRGDFHDWVVTSTTQRGPSGDVGLIYIKGGNCKAYRIYKYGGPGYIVRIYGLAEPANPRDCLTWDCAKFNSTEYGLEDFRWDNTMLIAGATQSDGFQIWNCTFGNGGELIGYWSSLGVIGTVDPAQINRMRNNIGFNLKTNGKPFIGMNQSGNTWNNDTANNQYGISATALRLDSVINAVTNSLGSFKAYTPTATSTGIILHGGQTNPLTGTDYFGAPMRVPPDLGYIQLPGAAPACNCLVGLHKGYKKYIRRPGGGTSVDFNNDFNNDFH